MSRWVDGTHLLDPVELLVAPIGPNRNDHQAAHLELLNQSAGHRGGGRAHMNGVVGTVLLGPFPPRLVLQRDGAAFQEVWKGWSGWVGWVGLG